MKIAYFGSSKVSIYVLQELKAAGYIPAVIVTTADKPQGRGLKLTPNIVKQYAIENNIKYFDPVKLDSAFATLLAQENCDLFIVASYGKIMPANIVNMPKYKTLNMHPSLLPKYRGASPLPTTMLDDARDTGITIMRMDEKMDHGPIVATKNIHIETWPTYEVFEENMAREGGRLLASILQEWVSGSIKEVEQDHTKATLTRKITKEDALLDLSGDPYRNFRAIQAYHEWPQAYFIIVKSGRKIRVKITEAKFENNKLMILKVIPEGSREMSFADFEKGYRV